MKIYLACQITGKSYEQVSEYLDKAKERLTKAGYEVLSPLTGKDYLRTGKGDPLPATGFTHYASTNHAIFERDKWMVSLSDVVFMNIGDMPRVSIGMMMELAWGSLLGKLTILALDPNNEVYKHAFIYEAADVICPTEEQALIYLEKLAGDK